MRATGIFAALAITVASANRLDANETRAFSRAFESVQAEIVKTDFPNFVGRDVFPVDTSVDPGADTFIWRQWTPVGIAQLITNYGTDVPSVSFFASENPSPIAGYQTKYHYSKHDLRRAALASKNGQPINLPTESAEAAKLAIEQRIEQMAFFGEASRGITGGANNASVPIINTFTTGNWDGVATTGANILVELRRIIQTVRTQSKNVHAATTLVVGTAMWAVLTKEVNSFSNKTLLDLVYEDRTMGIKEVFYTPLLDLADAQGDGERMIVLEKNGTKNTRQVIPLEFDQESVQQNGLLYEIHVECRLGGVSVQKPLSMIYVDGMMD